MNRYHRWACRSTRWKNTLEQYVVPWALQGVELGDHVLEIGPGPGLTSDLLRNQVPQLTAIEIDRQLAESLKQRLVGTNVTVVEGDATRMTFEDCSFSAAVSFNMLHHIASPELQDRLLGEAFRVLKPGGVFAGTDSRTNLAMRLIHIFDTLVPVDPATFGSRLESAGFSDVRVDSNKWAVRFQARR